MSDIIVKTNGLCADFKIKDRMVRAVNRVSLSLERGKTLVILGESGSGKSTYMKALLRILPKTAAVEGQAEFLGNDLFRMSEKEFRDRQPWQGELRDPERGVPDRCQPGAGYSEGADLCGSR